MTWSRSVAARLLAAGCSAGHTAPPDRYTIPAHNVRLHRTGITYFHHPVLGALDLAFDAMDLPADPGLSYSAEPGSPSEDALKLLASWTATADELPAN